MTVRIFVPGDASAVALGAEAVARAIAAIAQKRNQPIEIVRNGSRGLFWLEPLVEVTTGSGRIAYGPVTPRDVPELFSAGLLAGGAHRLRLEALASHPYLAKQERLTFARVGVIDPLSIEDYRAHGGFKGLERARSMAPVRHAHTRTGLRQSTAALLCPLS